MSVTHQPLSMRPLGQNNSQQQIGGQRQTVGKKSNKITAKADSTGLENSNAAAIAKHHHSVKKMQTASVVKRNLRERTRVRGVNDGFGNLKKYVPELKSKSSKVETLRGAIDYIKALKQMLGEDITDLCRPVSPVTKHEFMEDDLSDSNSSLSDQSLLSPTVTSSTTCLTSVKSEQRCLPSPSPLPQMVCGLPYADQSINLYSLPPLAPLASVPVSLPASLASLTPLPPMSISATNWWPEPKPEFQH